MKRYCVIGYPIKHTLSPGVHNAAFKKLKIAARYEACEVTPRELAAFMGSFKEKYAGANVTIPHKETVIKYLDKLSPEARAIGAVNVIVNRGGKLIGYNTDVVGAMTALRSCHPELVEGFNRFLRGARAIVLGAGGAARAVVYGLKKAGAKVTILNRTLSRAKKLAKDFGCEYASLASLKGQRVILSQLALSGVEGKDDILINTTSVGMWPNVKETPLPDFGKPAACCLRAAGSQAASCMIRRPSFWKRIPSATRRRPATPIVMDVIYRPRMTKFLRDAKKAGCQVITGDKMFLAQAAASFELWTGKKFPQ